MEILVILLFLLIFFTIVTLFKKARIEHSNNFSESYYSSPTSPSKSSKTKKIKKDSSFLMNSGVHVNNILDDGHCSTRYDGGSSFSSESSSSSYDSGGSWSSVNKIALFCLHVAYFWISALRCHFAWRPLPKGLV